MFEVTTKGHNMAMFEELNPKMLVVLNFIEIDEEYEPITGAQKEIIRDMIGMNLIRKV